MTNPSLRKKLAPQGWHVASDAEWEALMTCLGGKLVASYRGVEDDSEKMLIGEDRKSFYGKSVRCIKD